MPALDRRLTVRAEVGGLNEYGEAVTITEDTPVWATRHDASAMDQAQQGGQIQIASRSYTVRWRRDWATINVAKLSVYEEIGEDGEPILVSVSNISERVDPASNRRRFLVLDVLGETT